MNNEMMMKIDRLNEINFKYNTGTELTDNELKEQSLLREEIMNYIKYAIEKREGKNK